MPTKGKYLVTFYIKWNEEQEYEGVKWVKCSSMEKREEIFRPNIFLVAICVYMWAGWIDRKIDREYFIN